MTEIREAWLFGLREARTFRAAATKYLQDYSYKRRIKDDAQYLRQLDPIIGSLELKQVHMGSLEPFVAQRRRDAVKTKTINLALGVVRRILNLASSEWMDEHGMTWLESAPKIKLFPVTDARAPYPLAHDEVKVPELETSVFVVPADRVKNGEERLVVLNRVAKSVIDAQRGVHTVYVFAHARRNKGEAKPVTKMNNTAWKSARERAAEAWKERHGEAAPAGFQRVRVHDLKHTFGRRLRAAGVGFEDRQDLLGHRSGRITTHYSQAELTNLIEAADRVCSTESRKSPATTWLRRKSVGVSTAKRLIVAE
jgi:site-specific recombinase XerC